MIYNIIKVGVDKITLGRPLVLPLQNTGVLSAWVDQGGDPANISTDEKSHMLCGN